MPDIIMPKITMNPNSRCFFDRLGLEWNANDEEIEFAYGILSNVYQLHPELSSELLLIKEAYETLQEGGERLTHLLHSVCRGDLDVHNPGISNRVFDYLDGVDMQNERDELGLTPFLIACRYNQIDAAKLLLRYDADILNDTVENDGMNALLISCKYGHNEIVQWLIDQGLSLESRDHKQNTPLMLAAQHGHKTTVEWLLTQSVDTESTNADGLTAKDLCCQSLNYLFASTDEAETTPAPATSSSSRLFGTAKRGLERDYDDEDKSVTKKPTR